VRVRSIHRSDKANVLIPVATWFTPLRKHWNVATSQSCASMDAGSLIQIAQSDEFGSCSRRALNNCINQRAAGGT